MCEAIDNGCEHSWGVFGMGRGGGGGCAVVGGAPARRGVGGLGRVVPLVEVGVCLEEERLSFHLRYEASATA